MIETLLVLQPHQVLVEEYLIDLVLRVVTLMLTLETILLMIYLNNLMVAKEVFTLKSINKM